MAKKDKKKEKKEKELYPVKIKLLEIKLRVARKDDFLELDKYLEGGKKKWKLKIGVPYWMINHAGDIENDPYILTDDTNKGDFADWLVREQILIPVKRFE